jgi:hypothetical protein
MVMAHDTDNIATIPGLPVHPVQVAEQQRLAQVQKAVATYADVIAPAATPESIKDMSSATRQVLEKIGELLKEAPSLSPSDDRAPVRAVESAGPKPGIADIDGDDAESVNDHPVD